MHFTKNPKIPVYHPEVEAFEVTDNDGNYVGVIYTDFFPRDGKRAGAWMTEFKGQWKEENGKDSRPHVTIVMNFSRPTSDTPALLTYDEVETFLHEFGHALHGLLSDVTYASRQTYIAIAWNFLNNSMRTIFPKKNFSTALQSTTKPVKKFRSNW